MDKYSADYIVNTITSDSTSNIGDALGSSAPNLSIVVSPDAVFIKPLNLVIMTEDNYNKLKEK